jgi:CelD/BcsL family acetyltransferase involved in cellulose biosynthesis
LREADTLFTINEINTREGLEGLRGEWNRLLTVSEVNTIFLTHEWVTAWWRGFGEEKKLFILLVKDNERLIGIAPLMIEDRKIRFIGAPMSDYCDFIVSEAKEAVLGEVYKYILKGQRTWSNISLEEIKESSSTIPLSLRILPTLTKYFDVSFSNPCFSLNMEGMTADNINTLTNKKSLRRYINFFSRNGGVHLYKVEGLDRVHAVLDILFEQHSKLWGKRGMSSMFNEKRYKEFFRTLARELQISGNFDICALNFNDKIIATHLGFLYNKVYLSYCQSHDAAYSTRSPGIILQKLFIKRFFDEGFSEVDFSRGAEPYKLRFANRRRSNFTVTIYRNFRGFLIGRAYNFTKEKVIKNEKLHNLISKYKNRIATKVRRMGRGG